MLLVIFGAGASFDSSPTYTVGTVPAGMGEMGGANDYYRPPLAKDLFANRPIFTNALDRFPRCKAIVPRLRDPAVTSGEKSIETLLQQIEEEAKTYTRALQEVAAVRCYLQLAIYECERHWRQITTGITNYLTLLREIERTHKGGEPVCLVTFNYDTLLEDALESLCLEFKIKGMQDYTQKSALFRVFKLHGSVNWAQEAQIQLPTHLSLGNPPAVLSYMVEHAAELQASNRFVLCEPNAMGVADNRPVFPAIAIPTETKSVFQCPQEFIDELTSLLPNVTKLLTIGWRATEYHFLHLLNQLLRPGVQLYVVGGPRKNLGDALPGEEVKVRICESLTMKPPCSAFVDEGGFTEFIRSRRAEQWLRN